MFLNIFRIRIINLRSTEILNKELPLKLLNSDDFDLAKSYEK